MSSFNQNMLKTINNNQLYPYKYILDNYNFYSKDNNNNNNNNKNYNNKEIKEVKEKINILTELLISYRKEIEDLKEDLKNIHLSDNLNLNEQDINSDNNRDNKDNDSKKSFMYFILFPCLSYITYLSYKKLYKI